MSQACGCKIAPVMLDERDGLVGGYIMGKKIVYCPLHAAAGEMQELLQTWHDEFTGKSTGTSLGSLTVATFKTLAHAERH